MEDAAQRTADLFFCDLFEASKRLQVPQAAVMALIQLGELEAVYDGCRWLIPRASLIAAEAASRPQSSHST